MSAATAATFDTCGCRNCENAQRVRARLGGLVLERANNAVVEILNLALLLLGDLRLRLDYIPHLQHVLLDLLHVHRVGDDVFSARHLLDVRLEIADILAHDLRANDLALCGNIRLRRGGEGHWTAMLGCTR